MGRKRGGGGGGDKAKASSGAKGGKKAQAKHKTQQVVTARKLGHQQQKQSKKAPRKLSAADRLAEMRRRLDGGKFRMLNEQLYTTTGESAFSTFQSDPELFDVYHQGFREQADKWPVNPLDTFIDYVKRHPKAAVADFGCGDARLAESVNNTVHSFDLVSRKPHVTACNIAHVPLKKASVDIGVFCLALMGTTVREYVREAHRVLKTGGALLVAEVKSRFESESLGGITGFVAKMRLLGFDCHRKDERNKMFVVFEFEKSARKPQDAGPMEFKACEYKRR